MSYAVVSTFLGMLRSRRSVLRSYAVLSYTRISSSRAKSLPVT